MKSRKVRGSKSSMCPMSLEKRFRILPGRRGCETLLISPGRSSRRHNSQINQNNIFNAYAFNTLHIRMMSVVEEKERRWTLNKQKNITKWQWAGSYRAWFLEDWRNAPSAILPQGRKHRVCPREAWSNWRLSCSARPRHYKLNPNFPVSGLGTPTPETVFQ